MLISVIVPVFNTAQYLPVCIESILNQTYRNIEVILVDDGSEDESLKICRNYEGRDSRIAVIEVRHQGLVTARKLGVEKAKGEYCIFVDSDDWISTDLIKEALFLTEGGTIDIVNYSLQNVDGNKTTDWSYTVPEGIYEEEQMKFVYSRMMFDFEEGRPGIIQSLCSKMIKRNILREGIAAVNEKITLGEDAAIVYKAMLLSERIAVTNKCLYFYRVRQNSMYHSKDKDVFDKMCCFQEYMKGIFEGYDKEYKLKEQLKYYLMSFVRKGLEDIYGIKLLSLYRVPFKTEELRGKIVLYGAGNVGRAYYRQLNQEKEIEIVAWVDKGLKGEKLYNCTIEAPKILKNAEYDNIVIAVKESDVEEKIKEELSVIISEEKILWRHPKINWWEREITI